MKTELYRQKSGVNKSSYIFRARGDNEKTEAFSAKKQRENQGGTLRARLNRFIDATPPTPVLPRLARASYTAAARETIIEPRSSTGCID